MTVVAFTPFIIESYNPFTVTTKIEAVLKIVIATQYRSGQFPDNQFNYAAIRQS